MNEINNELGGLLRSYREQAFPNQGLRRAAENLGIVHYAHLFRIEAGQSIPSDETLENLLTAYGVNSHDRLHAMSLAHADHSDTIRAYLSEFGVDKFAEAMFRSQKPVPKDDHENPTEK